MEYSWNTVGYSFLKCAQASFAIFGVVRLLMGIYHQVNLRYLSFFFQAEDGIRDYKVTGVQTCALPISKQCGGCGSSATRRYQGSCKWRCGISCGGVRSASSRAGSVRLAGGNAASPATLPRSEEGRGGKGGWSGSEEAGGEVEDASRDVA